MIKKKSIQKINPKKTTTVAIKDYAQTLLMLKNQIKEAQIKATLAANKELIKLYWHIGKTIVERQRESAWGSNIIEKLAKDLQNSFPGLGGFSRTNIFRMKAFFEAYEKIPQAVGQLGRLPFFDIPWGHNALLIEKIKDSADRLWYAQKAIENGWSRSMLETWIKSELHKRQGKAVTNFSKTLPAPHSDMAQQSLKDSFEMTLPVRPEPVEGYERSFESIVRMVRQAHHERVYKIICHPEFISGSSPLCFQSLRLRQKATARQVRTVSLT